jgi:hypothetical protein
MGLTNYNFKIIFNSEYVGFLNENSSAKLFYNCILVCPPFFFFCFKAIQILQQFFCYESFVSIGLSSNKFTFFYIRFTDLFSDFIIIAVYAIAKRLENLTHFLEKRIDRYYSSKATALNGPKMCKLLSVSSS